MLLLPLDLKKAYAVVVFGSPLLLACRCLLGWEPRWPPCPYTVTVTTSVKIFSFLKTSKAWVNRCRLMFRSVLFLEVGLTYLFDRSVNLNWRTSSTFYRLVVLWVIRTSATEQYSSSMTRLTSIERSDSIDPNWMVSAYWQIRCRLVQKKRAHYCSGQYLTSHWAFWGPRQSFLG